MFAWARASSKSVQIGGVPLAALLLLMLAPASIAGDHYLTEYVGYDLGFPLPITVDCDQSGLGNVRFCEELEDDHWDKFTLFVRDSVGVPIGAYYAFRTNTGDVLEEGTFCQNVNGLIPTNATELYVEPGVPVPECMNPGTTGNVIVTWRVAGEATIAPPDEHCDEEHME